MQSKKLWLCAAIMVVAALLDQFSKSQILSHFTYGERINIIPHFFDLILVYNPGAAFSFLANAGGWQKFFFMALALVISIYLIRAIWRNEFDRLGNLGASLIVGGAAGNVIDRLMHGHVVDFLLFYHQHWFFPAFNLADSFICVGAACLLLEGWWRHRKTGKVSRT
ncbi:signal peptidase II [Neisseriaceae bacterium ESL0693]|nr:signal peptidase II [Neisseriaceae bacterium ESL0693]